MKKIKTTIYRCEHCNKPYFSQSGCKKHESWCFRNPEKKSCSTCVHSVAWSPCLDSENKEFETVDVNNGNDIVIINCKSWESFDKFMEKIENDN